MEVLTGSAARRAASVVARAPLAAAVVPYAAAKEYLARNPLVSRWVPGWRVVGFGQPSLLSALCVCTGELGAGRAGRLLLLLKGKV